MRKMHEVVIREARSKLPSHAHVYIWNDSVLLLAFLDLAGTTPETVLREVDGLKRKIDRLANDYGLGESYTISVKGQAFPDIEDDQEGLREAGAAQDRRATIIKASSYAMANCFVIEKSLKTMKKPWYVDSRLAKAVRTDAVAIKKKVRLLPGPGAREVYIYSGSLWSPPPVNSRTGKS